MNSASIAVIGGGLAGLTAGYALSKRGARVVLFEAEPRLGGRAGTDEVDDLRVDPGAQLFASMYDRFVALVREIGLGDRLVRVPGRDALWRDGRAHEVVYGSVASMATSGGLPLLTRMRLGTTYAPFLARHAGALDIHRPERAAAAGLDEESIASWGKRELDDTFVEALVYPQLAAYYGTVPEDTSAGFYHILAHHGMNVTLYAVAGGIGLVADRLAERIAEGGGEVRAGAPVRRLELEGDSAHVSTDEGTARFDAVVSAIPAPELLRIASGAPPPLSDWLRSVRYRPVLTLTLVLREPLRRNFFGLSFPRGTKRYVAALAIQERKGVPLNDRGRGAVVAFATPEAIPSLMDRSPQEILDLLLPELQAALPELSGSVTRARVYRWAAGSAVFPPGYLGRLGTFRTADLESGAPLALAGDYLYNPSVEGAVASALDAVERLERRRS